MHSIRSAVCNRLLKTLPPPEFDRLAPLLVRVPLGSRQILETEQRPIEAAYFVERGILSTIAFTPKRDTIEVAMIGPEGMSGLPLIAGTDRSPHRTVVQVAGEAWRIGADEFLRLMEREPLVRRHLARFAQAVAVQVGQTALANGRYTLEQRLARWLVMCLDRLPAPEVPLTHELLSQVIGVRRPGVTSALHMLEGARIIACRRGRITILDRAALEQVAAGSYGAAEAEYARLIGVPIR